MRGDVLARWDGSMGARTFGDQGRPIGDWRGINHYQRRSHSASSRGSIYTSCSLFPAFTITAQKHDASLLVPQLTICRARKAHCRPHLQGLAATGAEVSKGPRGQGAKGPGQGAGKRTQSCCRYLQPSAQHLVNFSSSSRREPVRVVFSSNNTSRLSPQLSVPRIPPR